MLRNPDWFSLFQEGEEPAHRELYEKYYRHVCYFATKILHDNLYAEDIVSETFQKAWKQRTKFATPRHLENFLYLVTKNTCITRLKHDRTVERTDEEWVQLMLEDVPAEGPLDVERARTLLIGAIVAELKTLRGGEVLRMSYIEGKTTREIAVALNITENNVYILKHRSLKELRNRFSSADWMLIVLLFLRVHAPDDLLRFPDLSSIENHATPPARSPAALLRTGQAGD